MRDDCVRAVTEAALKAGRDAPTAKQLVAIEDRINKHVSQIGSEIRAGDQRLLNMTPTERMVEAGKRAADEIKHEKEKAAVRVAQQITKTRDIEVFSDKVAPKVGGQVQAMLRTLAGYGGIENRGFKSLDQRRQGIFGTYMGEITPFIKATEKYAGFWTDRRMVDAFVDELWNKDSGSKMAKEAAGTWLDVADRMRRQSNESGSDIRKLGSWHAPQAGLHDPLKIAAAGQAKWVTDNWERFQRPANPDGSDFSDAQYRRFLHEAWEPLATDGASEMKPGTFGTSSIKSRGSESRVLHFVGPDSYKAYHAQYSSTPILNLLASHINHMATNIAAMDTFGPNVESAMRYLTDRAVQKDILNNPTKEKQIRHEAGKIEDYFAAATGKIGVMANPVAARRWQGLRSIVAMASLKFAPISALGDTSILGALARANNIPALQAWKNELRFYGPAKEQRAAMRTAGIGLETVLHNMNRFNDDSMGHGVPSKLANQMFRVNGLNLLDTSRRLGMGSAMYEHVGDLVDRFKTISEMGDEERILKSKGITDNDFAIWRMAEKNEDGQITPQAVYAIPDSKMSGWAKPDRSRREAAQALAGYAASQVQMVVPMMTAKVQGDVRHVLGVRQHGAFFNEARYSALQFKSFIISMLENQWAYMMSQPKTAGKFMYATKFIASTMFVGAISLQLKSLLKGENPQSMDPTTPEGRRFLLKALLQGGSFGLWGDLVAGPISQNKWRDLAEMLGPIYSLTNKSAKMLFDSYRAITGDAKESKAAAQTAAKEAIDIIHSVTPQTWYSAAVTDHAIFQQLQDLANPGYNRRVEQEMLKQQGTSYYWSRGEPLPRQMPDLTTAGGR